MLKMATIANLPRLGGLVVEQLAQQRLEGEQGSTLEVTMNVRGPTEQGTREMLQKSHPTGG